MRYFLFGSKGRIFVTSVMSLITLALVIAGAGLWWIDSQVRNIPRFGDDNGSVAQAVDDGVKTEVSLPEKATGGVRAVLIVSLGSAGMTEEETKQAGVGGYETRDGDGLTDMMMLALIHPDTAKVSILSLPRDIWLDDCGCRLNSVLKHQGPQALVDEVNKITGVEVNNIMALNFAGFADMVDAVGGIDMYIPQEIRDPHSGLEQTQIGCVTLNGVDALSFVRSRKAQYKVDGTWQYDPLASDLKRIKRQQIFLNAASKKLLNSSLAYKLPDYLNVAQDNLTLDENLGTTDLVSLARTFGEAQSNNVFSYYTVVTSYANIDGQSVVVFEEEQSQAVLDDWRNFTTKDTEKVTNTPTTPGSVATEGTSNPVHVNPQAGEVAGIKDPYPC